MVVEDAAGTPRWTQTSEFAGKTESKIKADMVVYEYGGVDAWWRLA